MGVVYPWPEYLPLSMDQGFGTNYGITTSERDLHISLSGRPAVQDQSNPRMIRAVITTINMLTSAGFVINVAKSDLVPSQYPVYVEGRFQTNLGIVTLPDDRYSPIQAAGNSFQPGMNITANCFQHLLGLMALTLEVTHWASFHMKPLQSF